MIKDRLIQYDSTGQKKKQDICTVLLTILSWHLQNQIEIQQRYPPKTDSFTLLFSNFQMRGCCCLYNINICSRKYEVLRYYFRCIDRPFVVCAVAVVILPVVYHWPLTIGRPSSVVQIWPPWRVRLISFLAHTTIFSFINLIGWTWKCIMVDHAKNQLSLNRYSKNMLRHFRKRFVLKNNKNKKLNTNITRWGFWEPLRPSRFDLFTTSYILT